MATRHYDLIVIGGGTGRDVALAAEARGLRVALVERGPLGGTCHNRGCMPTKMLIHSSDVAVTARDGARFGVRAPVEAIDFPSIVRNVFGELDAETEEREESLEASRLIDFVRAEVQFTGPRTIAAGDDELTADRIVIAAGTRPVVPPIPGLVDVDHVTSDGALRLESQPRRLGIIGGGYIAVELAHFFAGLGTEVTMLVRGERLLDREDLEISEWLTREYADRVDLRLRTGIASVARSEGGTEVHFADGGSVEVDLLLLATGRRPNADLLALEHAGVEVDERGCVAVNERFETSTDGVYAFGDVTGGQQLKHVAVREAKLLARGLFEGEWGTLNEGAVPHAVFSSPQVAGVGRTEEELAAAGESYAVGRHEFRHTGMGMALKENGLVKVLVGEDRRLLGCHIVGPHASVLIQEPTIVMTAGGTVDMIVDAVHAHPALPQVVEEACKAAIA
jgi:dihydrolipoamide dehydrogenase